MSMAKEEKVDTTLTMNDGSYQVPIISVDCVPVNKGNMVDVAVKNNFHSLETYTKMLLKLPGQSNIFKIHIDSV
jgi:ABC-type xylose transport system substrate-binding protein